MFGEWGAGFTVSGVGGERRGSGRDA